MKKQLFNAINENADTLKRIALYIGEHPELGNEEVLACAELTGELKRQGFRVETDILGLPTAFIATYESGKPGPIVAFLCEYDALPGLGHACGHHLICTMGLGAAIGLKSVLDGIGGVIRVYGTPAEETKGAKVPMSEAGLFDDVDIALMAHPFHRFEKSGSSLAMDALQFEYFGKSAHAAANPQDGVNALDAVLMLFNSLNALRQQLASHARIHGVITAGGEAPNIIPEYASAKFYVRSANRPYTDETVRKVIHCAEGAALQTGCTLATSNYEYSYDELSTNGPLSEAFTANLVGLGVAAERIYDGQDHGSLDLGNVSRRCPSIHPFVQVIDETHMLHTPEFRDFAMTERALDGMILSAKALAATAYDVISDTVLLQNIKSAFRATK
jgi:amidohydrolase